MIFVELFLYLVTLGCTGIAWFSMAKVHGVVAAAAVMLLSFIANVGARTMTKLREGEK